MDNRKYNIYFHTHTISGIIICALLYVIFFAGSFAFFKDDLSAWQKSTSYLSQRNATEKDFNKILDSLSLHHNLKGRDFDITMQKHGMGAYVSMSASNDTTVKKKKTGDVAPARGRSRIRNGDSAYFTYNFFNQQEVDYAQSYDMGEFLYRLHFLAQLNQVPIRLGAPFGYLLAGVVSFIFLFALITGLLLHWDKIVSNFFVFRPWSKWKTVWTDMHTALGVIGFPFQLIFAVTGVVLIVNSFLLSPYTKFLYKGDSAQLYHDLHYSDNTKFDYSYKPLQKVVNLNKFVSQVERNWDEAAIRTISIRNFQDANMHIILAINPDPVARFSGSGKIIYRVRDNKILLRQSPLSHSDYIDKVRALVYRLHFGDFGGRPLKVMFFVLGLLGCVVIISGILIWLVARDKKNVPEHKRVFNFWTANIFLASSLSMLPVTAFTMIVLLFIKDPGQSDIYHWYFYSWLLLSIYFILRRDLAVINRHSLILSGISCFLVPVFHGIMRNNWIWKTFERGEYDILFIDLLFLVLSVICVLVLWKMPKPGKMSIVTNL